MESWSRADYEVFAQEVSLMSHALSEVVETFAIKLKDLHRADVTKAVEAAGKELTAQNMCLNSMNNKLRMQVEVLQSTEPDKVPLLHHVAPAKMQTSADQCTLEQDFEQPPSQHESQEPSRGIISNTTIVPVADLKNPSDSELVRSSQCHSVLTASQRLAKADRVLIREVWSDAMRSTAMTHERLSFTVATRDHGILTHRGSSITPDGLVDICACELGIIHPASSLRMLWSLLCCLAILFDVIMIPLQAFDMGDVTSFNVIEIILALFWTSDVLMTFRTGYFIGSNVEMRQYKIAVHYMRTWLCVDLIVVILEWLSRFLNITGSASLLRSTRAARNIMGFMKLVRLSKMKKVATPLKEQINSNIFRLSCTLFALCFAMVLLVHISACIWYAIGAGAEDGWTSTEEYKGRKDRMFWYVASVRWIVSQLNGRTDMNPTRNMRERLFTCVMGIVLALIAHAIFISIITKTMIELSGLVSQRTRRRRLVNEYLEANPLVPAITWQVKRCLYEYKNTSEWAEKEASVLSILPGYLQSIVLYQVRAPVIMKHSFFHILRYESPWAMRLVCRTVVHVVPISKYEVIFDKGDACTRILFTDKLDVLYGNPDKENAVSTAAEIGFHFGASRRRNMTTFKTDAQSRTLSNTEIVSEMQSMMRFGQFFGGDAQTILPGEWVSEAALWTKWRNQGRLVAHDHGVMLGAHADDLAGSLMKHPAAFAMAAMYVEKFVEHLKLQEKLSDVIHYEVRTLAPVLLHVTVISASNLTFEKGKLFQEKSEVYCTCNAVWLSGSSGEARFRTPGVPDIHNPMWYHSSRVNLSRHQSLLFQVWGDVLIGEAKLDPEDFLPAGFAGDRLLSTGNGLITLQVEVGELTGMEAS